MDPVRRRFKPEVSLDLDFDAWRIAGPKASGAVSVAGVGLSVWGRNRFVEVPRADEELFAGDEGDTRSCAFSGGDRVGNESKALRDKVSGVRTRRIGRECATTWES